MARQEMTVAQRRRMICQPGYYNKRKKHFKRQERFWARYVASPTKFSEAALANMLRCQSKAEYYRRREGMEPALQREVCFEPILTEARFRMLAREIRLMLNWGAESKRESLIIAARLLYKIFRVTVPEEWIDN